MRRTVLGSATKFCPSPAGAQAVLVEQPSDFGAGQGHATTIRGRRPYHPMVTSMSPAEVGAKAAKVSIDRSMRRPVATVGPRSFTLQDVTAPVAGRVTVTMVPNGSVRWAQVRSGALNQEATPASLWPATLAAGAGGADCRGHGRREGDRQHGVDRVDQRLGRGGGDRERVDDRSWWGRGSWCGRSWGRAGATVVG